ncbi:MAG: hypothetical protein MJZ86_08265 [Bacteroidales bacterium]|nr:hypothetical protein [Bacteroidales bacterium]
MKFFVVSLVVSIILLVGGFCAPPMGVIDGSVLSAVGELFAFASLAQLPAILGKKGNVKITHGKTSIDCSE